MTRLREFFLNTDPTLLVPLTMLAAASLWPIPARA
jgi:hypothetical protein